MTKIKRQTVQKIRIMEYLMSTKSHPTAEDVYAVVSKEIPTISLSTVYRNLNVMAEDGEILKFEVGNEAHFDADISFHHHVYCKVCKNVFDLFDDSIADYIKENVSIPEFIIESTSLIFTGKCTGCILDEKIENKTQTEDEIQTDSNIIRQNEQISKNKNKNKKQKN